MYSPVEISMTCGYDYESVLLGIYRSWTILVYFPTWVLIYAMEACWFLNMASVASCLFSLAPMNQFNRARNQVSSKVLVVPFGSSLDLFYYTFLLLRSCIFIWWPFLLRIPLIFIIFITTQVTNLCFSIPIFIQFTVFCQMWLITIVTSHLYAMYRLTHFGDPPIHIIKFFHYRS